MRSSCIIPCLLSRAYRHESPLLAPEKHLTFGYGAVNVTIRKDFPLQLGLPFGMIANDLFHRTQLHCLAGVGIFLVDQDDAGRDAGAVEQVGGQADDPLDIPLANEIAPDVGLGIAPE